MLKLKLQYFGHMMWRTDSLEKTLMLGKIEGRRIKGQQRMRWLDVASPTWWTWVWAGFGSWWWTGKPSMLQFLGWQSVGQDWVTELTEDIAGSIPDHCNKGIAIKKATWNFFFWFSSACRSYVYTTLWSTKCAIALCLRKQYTYLKIILLEKMAPLDLLNAGLPQTFNLYKTQLSVECNIYLYICIYIYTYVYMCMYVYICVCVCIYLYIYLYIYGSSRHILSIEDQWFSELGKR